MTTQIFPIRPTTANLRGVYGDNSAILHQHANNLLDALNTMDDNMSTAFDELDNELDAWQAAINQMVVVAQSDPNLRVDVAQALIDTQAEVNATRVQANQARQANQPNVARRLINTLAAGIGLAPRPAANAQPAPAPAARPVVPAPATQPVAPAAVVQQPGNGNWLGLNQDTAAYPVAQDTADLVRAVGFAWTQDHTAGVLPGTWADNVTRNRRNGIGRSLGFASLAMALAFALFTVVFTVVFVATGSVFSMAVMWGLLIGLGAGIIAFAVTLGILLLRQH